MLWNYKIPKIYWIFWVVLCGLGHEDADKHEDEAWKKHLLENGPVILSLHANVTVVVGGTTQLPCRIKNLGEYTVSSLSQFEINSFLGLLYVYLWTKLVKLLGIKLAPGGIQFQT